MSLQSTTLHTIGGGALTELFAVELAKVLANIADINTDPEAKRKITIEVTFAPADTRDTADVALKCVSKLVGIKTVSTQVFIGKLGGKLVAVEHDPRQAGLFDAEPTGLRAIVSDFPTPEED